MGVLDIRRSSETLHNISIPRMASVDTGAVQAAQSNMRAIQSVAHGAEGLGRSVREFAEILMRNEERENQKKIDQAVLQYQQGMNDYNRGENGAMLRTIGNESEWLAENVKFRNEFSERTKKDLGLTDYQYEQMNNRLVGYNLTMQNEWSRRAESVGASRQIGTATSNMAGFNETVASTDASPLAWIDWKDGVDALISANERKEGRQLSDEEKQNIRRSQALVVYKAMVQNQGNYLTSQATDAERTGEDGAKVFDTAIAAMEGAEATSFLPPSTTLSEPKSGRTVNIMEDALAGSNMDKLKIQAIEEIRDAKKRYVADFYGRQSIQWRQARNETIQQEIGLISAPIPDTEAGQTAYYDQLAKDYEKLSANPKLSPSDRLSYLELSRRLGQKSSRVSSEAKDVEYGVMLDNFRLGARPSRVGDSDSFVPYTADQMKNDADTALKEDRISVRQWMHLSGLANKKKNEEFDAENDEAAVSFLNAILGKYGKLVPGAIKYHEDRNAFDFNPSQTTLSKKIGTDTPVPNGPKVIYGKDDDDQIATYGQMIQVANAIIAQRRGTKVKMTSAQMLEQFDREFGPTARGRVARSAAEKISMLENASKAW